jgi:hypothetical protein
VIALLLALHCPDSFHLRWVAAQAEAFPPTRFEAIARVESGCNLATRLRGHHCLAKRDCEVGRFQIKPSTARKRCPGYNIWTYDGNVRCALTILGDNRVLLGLTDATRRFNGAGPASFEYLYKVLKREEAP